MFKKGDKPVKPLAKGNTLAVKHSLHVYRRMLSGNRLDGRTSLHKVLREKEQEFISALGGDPSPQEKWIIADAVKTMLYVGTLDEYLINLDGGIVSGSKVIPAVDTRTQLAAHVRRNLETLGLKRAVKTLSVQDVLNQDDDHETQANGVDHDQSLT